MSTPARSVDAEHLDLLGVFHYVVAALTGLFALVPVIHLVIGLGLVTGRLGQQAEAPDEARLVGWLFVGIALFLILLGLACAVLFAYAGRCLRGRRRYMLCMVAAAIASMFVPFGTVLGVFTLIVLSRPGVRAMFH
ncbi:hypothetical protein [Lysobacter sp. N42]|uniref:hypothetical protein n=1 Tax=Lysobacter sp. N42 TaxID=2545719 RepID=UPI00104EC846|nr:hypothetical protein [Lysobacter sp. N42]TCZ83899.1 hypothetical protein EYQ95_20970 [Lysobacter sp. N42]